ncbi:MAG: hypothetical protein KDM63_01185, partial [Verrucomicrobiae bacterium]|nr:hypothetical protein [Verrucomicrobiae bacterium]
MMVPRTSDLESLLAKSPEDWSIRIRLIEQSVRADDMDAARRYVRDSPDEAPLPPELQFRLHTLMVHGTAAFSLLGEEVEEVTEPAAEVAAPSAPKSSVSRDLVDPAEVVPSRTDESKSLERSSNSPPVDSEVKSSKADHGVPVQVSKLNRSSVGWVKVDLKALRAKEAKRWHSYDGDLNLEAATELKVRERQIQTAQKFSAFSFALVLHIVLFLLVGFIVISVPRPRPPQLIASVELPKRPTNVPVPPKIVKDTESTPSSASAMTPNVIGALTQSPVTIPEMEMTNSVDVTTQITGVAPVGQGLSFSGDAREMSNVNFFGISAGGKRIVFIVDATPEMLLDEKGGMYAYDKVKNEIGIMLAGLNRGTKFNILLYEGGRLLAFAEEPVVAMPSSLRMAIEWLQPLNRNYDRLGLNGHQGQNLEVAG